MDLSGQSHSLQMASFMRRGRKMEDLVFTFEFGGAGLGDCGERVMDAGGG